MTARLASHQEFVIFLELIKYTHLQNLTDIDRYFSNLLSPSNYDNFAASSALDTQIEHCNFSIVSIFMSDSSVNTLKEDIIIEIIFILMTDIDTKNWAICLSFPFKLVW